MYSGYPQRQVLSREEWREGGHRAEGGAVSQTCQQPWALVWAPGCRSRQGPLPADLGPALFEDDTVGVQTLDKYRVILEESCQTGLQDRHTR